jgi:hypothetical protein
MRSNDGPGAEGEERDAHSCDGEGALGDDGSDSEAGRGDGDDRETFLREWSEEVLEGLDMDYVIGACQKFFDSCSAALGSDLAWDVWKGGVGWDELYPCQRRAVMKRLVKGVDKKIDRLDEYVSQWWEDLLSTEIPKYEYFFWGGRRKLKGADEVAAAWLESKELLKQHGLLYDLEPLGGDPARPCEGFCL